jgi:hypothetical protein
MTREELSDWAFTQFIICGCGEPECVLEKLRDLLKYYSMEWEDRKRQRELLSNLIGSDEYGCPQTTDGWMWVYLLCRLDLTEHGGNVIGSWLTGKGEQILAALEEHGCDPHKWEEGEL